MDTGSGMKNDKLKSKDFFDVKENPLITFQSKKIVQTGSPPPLTCKVSLDTWSSKPGTLTLTISGKGTGSGEIQGTMVKVWTVSTGCQRRPLP